MTVKVIRKVKRKGGDSFSSLSFTLPGAYVRRPYPVSSKRPGGKNGEVRVVVPADPEKIKKLHSEKESK